MDRTQLLQAFSFAKDTAIQFITISTVIIGVTITFLKEFVRPRSRWRYLLIATWISLSVSILFGILNLLSLTGTLASSEPLIGIGAELRFLAKWQEITFGVGLLIFMLYGVVFLWIGPNQNPAP
jgi:hypothetical protein